MVETMREATLRTPASRILLALWLCFMARGVFYVLATPVWEGVDEYSHFAYLEHIAAGAALISDKQTVPLDITESFDALPLPRAMVAQLNDKRHLDYEAYWALTAAERVTLHTRLMAILPATRERLESRWIGIYERQQPPLYYWLMSPIYWICQGWRLVDRVMLIRLAGMLMGSLAVPAVFWLMKQLAGVRWGIGAAAIAVSMPGLLITVSRAGNECLAVAAGSALTVAAVKLAKEGAGGQEPSLKTAWLTGLALSAALLTKAYFLACAAVLGLWLLWQVATKRSKGMAAAVVIGLPVVLAGWWYVRNLAVTGSLSGEQTDAAMRQLTVSRRFAAFGEVHWGRAFDTLFFSHIFTGGWSFLLLRAWMYEVLGVLWILAIAGIVTGLATGRARLDGPPSEAGWRRSLGMMALLEVGLLAALAYHTLVTFAVLHESATNGWYLYSLVAAECLLMAWGLTFWLRERSQAVVFPALAGLFAALDLFGMHVYLLPYYTGLTAHAAQGGVKGWKLAEASTSDWGTLFERLTVNKPEVLGTGLLAALWVAYLIATLATPGLAWFAAITPRVNTAD